MVSREELIRKGAIDPYSRYQKQLSVSDIFPYRTDGRCACGCGTILIGRRTRWTDNVCRRNAYIYRCIIWGDIRVIRDQLLYRDKGVCAKCHITVEDPKGWQADHIIPVYKGGGGCTLKGYQTLCIECHKEKTVEDMAR